MRLTIWVGFWIFLADQLSKYLVVHVMDLRNLAAIDIFPPFLTFRMAWNYGINFGLLSNDSTMTRWILIAIACVISSAVLWWIRKGDEGKWVYISAGLLIGGAMGNVIDRILYGAVADFLNMSCCGFENPYAFNVADIAIFAGAIGLIIFTKDDKKAA